VSNPARRELAAQQAALARALLGQGPVPGGFNAGRVAAMAETLAHKRLHAAARAWPLLARQLGDAWAVRFAATCAGTPLPPHHGPLLDGWRVAEVLEGEGLLGPAATRELLGARLRFRRGPEEGLQPRTGAWAWALARSAEGRCLALRLAGRTFSVWLPGRRAPSPPPPASSPPT